MTLEKDEESDSKNIKGREMYVKNPKKWIKNHGLSKNGMFLLCSNCIMYQKRSLLYNKGVLASYHLNFLLSSLKYLLGFLP